MSSYLAFRYIVDDSKDFFPNLSHQIYKLIPEEKKYPVCNEVDVDVALQKQFDSISNKRLGILISGGMDSACLASYMRGQDAYTFRFLGGSFQKEELARAEKHAAEYNLKIHYVDITWETVEKSIDKLMETKGAPVHSIEPQIYQAALQAKNDGIDMMIIGDAADYVFGGMDQLHAKDWLYEEFKERFIYINPADVLNEPVDLDYHFAKYKQGNHIDFIALMHEYTDIESYASYENAFHTAGMAFLDPYEHLNLTVPLDLSRIRNGESKYIIRALYKMKYPSLNVPEKRPMPRPVDEYFENWTGPKRPEFKSNLDMNKYTGNQKWLLWCLERFLNTYDK